MQITVLIVDDNKLMREALSTILLSGIVNIQIVGNVSNGEEAIDLANKLQPDLIFMDINMSPVNGFEATRKILKQNSSIKIIGFSLHNEKSYAVNMMKLGAKGYLTKGASPEEIIEAVKKITKGGKYIDARFKGKI